MVRVVLQPASGDEAQEHYRNTIEKFVDLANANSAGLLTTTEYSDLNGIYEDSHAWVWGARTSMGAEWRQDKRRRLCHLLPRADLRFSPHSNLPDREFAARKKPLG